MKISEHTNIIKSGFVILLLIIELILYYSLGSLSSFFIQFLILCYLFYWYYSERKSTFNYIDKLLIASTSISLFSPLTVYFPDFFIGNIIKFSLIAINYILTIIIFKIEGAKIKFAGKSNMFLIFASYIFMPFAFFATVIYPLTNSRTAIISGIYMLPLIYMVFLSTFLSFPEKSKLYISLSMFFVLLASGVSAYRIYISTFFLDYALVRICVTLCRLFMLLGMIHRFQPRINESLST
jgi:hypothetical protein